ncbi:germination protein YpeB [Mechercharimyces sp. CAU 1602]|uniref:germination protein YpeB n=1 Tax=Mechercharimyces sp. CAU 1602 TaxID=2973933 RepID=UPI0021617EC1|nr:germination protein YpeB [Mechercharimyces sp. CAU 1602]MCS1350961.1 germination protein YpeB [Mechercharimyces sp. CAU 1602]
MYKRIAAYLFPIATILFIGTAVWGYQVYQERSEMLVRAENQYQRSFHELNYHMVKLQEELGKSLALNTRKQLSSCMTNIWRLSYAAQSDVSQLPLRKGVLDQTEEWVSKMGDFAYRVGVRDLTKEPLNEQEWKTLNTLYDGSSKVQKDLQKVQSDVLSKRWRWIDAEKTLQQEKKGANNPLVDGIQNVNSVVSEYTEVDWGPTANNIEQRKREKYTNLQGKEISADEAKKKTAAVLGLDSTKGMKVALNKNGEYEFYSVQAKVPSGVADVDVTKRGGHVVWMMKDREVKESKLTLAQTRAKAEAFLKQIPYTNMVAVAYDQAGKMDAFTFIHRDGDVMMYPETVVVKVAEDNGEVMGMQAEEFVFNHEHRSNAKPKLTLEKARSYVSPKLQVKKDNLAVIYGDTGDPVLCYEFLGNIKGNQYRIFINASTGDEEFVEKVQSAASSL